MPLMIERENQPDSANPPGTDVAISYRCVCGEVTRLEPSCASCLKCGRQYDYRSLRKALAATTALYTDAADSHICQLEETPDDDKLIGRRLQHFRILSRLGSGGMGAVYRALDESLQRYVALKVIFNPGPAAGDDGLEGAFQEARAQARVNHAHVAHIYYVGSDADIPFLAMELVGERTLADKMEDGPLPFEEVVRFGLQIARALQHAAMFDIVHGDVKPNNVLLVDDHTAKLSDFGLARRLSQSATPTSAAGTPEFVAPEVTMGQRADHRSDMYSLGVTLFRMTFGRMPYSPSSHELAQTLRMHRDASVEFPDPWPGDLPVTWRGVLSRLLAKAPGNRYQDFPQLILELERHEPVVLPNARASLRGLAWLFDSFLLSLPLALIRLVFSAQLLSHFSLGRIATETAIFLAFCYLQAVWGTTPGKRLFQIRIVDQLGLPPSQTILGARAACQFIWAWALIAGEALSMFRMSLLATPVIVVVVLFLLVEIVLVVFAKGRSLHDRISRTQVVLDAVPKRLQ